MAGKEYKVVCWGACEGAGDCHIYWGLDPRTGEFRRVIQEGDIVPDDFPLGSIKHELEAGHIQEIKAGSEE